MSLWGKLAGLAGIVAAPFTGGTSLAWVPAAFGAGAAIDGALDGGGDEGGGMGDLSSAWGANGLFTGDSTVTGDDGRSSGSGGLINLAMKYGLPALAGAIRSGQMNHQAEQQLQFLRDKLAEDTAARKQSHALEESKLDPFRASMAQARDVGKLDMQAEGNFASSPVQADSKYGAGLNVQPEQFYTPSPVMRAVARGARADVAAGKTMPSMSDPASYGKTPVGHYTDPAAPGTTPAGDASDVSRAPATAFLAALRSKGLLDDGQTDNQTSPWLAV